MSAPLTQEQALKVAIISLASLYPEDAERAFGLDGLKELHQSVESLNLAKDVEVFGLLKNGLEAPKE